MAPPNPVEMAEKMMQHPEFRGMVDAFGAAMEAEAKGEERDGPAAASPSSSKKAKKKKKAAAAAAAAAAAPKSAALTPAQIFTQIIVDDSIERSQWDGASVAKSAEAQWGEDEYWRRMRARVTKVIHDHDLMSTASGLEIIDDALLEAIDGASSLVFARIISELSDAEKAGRLKGGHNGKFEGKDKGKGRWATSSIASPRPCRQHLGHRAQFLRRCTSASRCSRRSTPKRCTRRSAA